MSIRQGQQETLTELLPRVEVALNNFMHCQPERATPDLVYYVYRGSLRDDIKLRLNTKYSFDNRVRELPFSEKTRLLREYLYVERSLESKKRPRINASVSERKRRRITTRRPALTNNFPAGPVRRKGTAGGRAIRLVRATHAVTVVCKATSSLIVRSGWRPRPAALARLVLTIRPQPEVAGLLQPPQPPGIQGDC